MKLDLVKSDYNSQEEYEEYIYGSADVVGLMCLKVFVSGQDNKYEELKVKHALGICFSKVNHVI
jgi:phytoene/squalene synthetase